MSQKDAIAMFGEAKEYTPETVRKLIDLAVRAEREACALLAYGYREPDKGGSWRESIAAAIRARGQA